MSSYLIDRISNRYGGQQEDYLRQVNEIVETTATSFRQARETGQDLTQLFHDTLASLGERRHRIAIEHRTNKSDKYGIRRDLPSSFSGPFTVTFLHHPYEEYNARLISFLLPHLKNMNYTPKKFIQTKSTVVEEKCLGLDSCLEIELLTFEKVNEWGSHFSSEDLDKWFSLSSFTPPNPQEEGLTTDILTHDIETMKKLKNASIKEYKRLKTSLALQHIRTEYPGERKSDYALITVRSEVNENPGVTKGRYALSQYLIWLYRDFKTDPFENMAKKAFVAVLHQDPFLIESMLNDISHIFKKALEWQENEHPLQDLKNDVAHLVYKSSHAMPFKRGSSAIIEWLEMAIYQSHGYRLSYNREKMANLEALTSTLKKFVDHYDTMIQLKKIEPNEIESSVIEIANNTLSV